MRRIRKKLWRVMLFHNKTPCVPGRYVGNGLFARRPLFGIYYEAWEEYRL
jgi:hypothetical protein